MGKPFWMATPDFHCQKSEGEMDFTMIDWDSRYGARETEILFVRLVLIIIDYTV